MILREQKREESVACKVAVAGDYLPAGSLQLRDAATCAEMAHRVAPLFEDADIAFVNLESPVDVSGLPPAAASGLGATLSAPPQVLQYLSILRVKPVSLANNHIFDYGFAGFERTRNAVRANGLAPLGCGNTLNDPPEIYVWESPAGLRVGFWAAANISTEPASTSKPGTEIANLRRGKLALAALQKAGAQCCIALLHAGLEQTNCPDPADVAMMDELARAGFRLVAACHSHRISGYKLIETSHGAAACFYGLGSISSGMMYTALEREGIVAVLSLNARGELVGLSANAVAMSDSGWGNVPTAQEEETILGRFRGVSESIADGSYRQRFHQEVGQGMFRKAMRDFRAAFRGTGVQGIARKFGRLRVRHIRRAFHAIVG
jgi:poly-gamma-glutamate capsule biosynthesis protein CapA/YwtB (metallophosphatase superfamily)